MLGVDTRAARVIWTAMLFALGLALVWILRKVLLLLAFAVVFAYLVFPVVRLVERFGPFGRRRVLALLLVYLVIFGGLTVVGVVVGPRLTSDTAQLAQKIPAMSHQIQSGAIVSKALERRGWETDTIDDIERFVREHAHQMTGYAQAALAVALKSLTNAWLIVLVPIFAFFFMKDAEHLRSAVETTLPSPHARRVWRGIIDDVHHLLGGYVRALILLSLITFVVWTGLFLIARVPYPLMLAAIGGALEFIPLVGPVVAGAVVMTVAIFAGYPHPLALLGFLIVWRLIQDYVSSPLVMGSGVELHPALIVFAVIAGGEIGGPTGMFLSIPVIAALRIVWRRLGQSEAVSPK
ncbi:MAG: AI-2E family transporter [Candidatus Rokubacteria bacterium]|nr:AI-2E family transporter [Candidatus Rokubacteria bacterium]